MCGIVGVRALSGGAVDGAVLRRMSDQLAHRGPDDEGHLVRGPVGLGHRRLSIIDVGSSRQPMSGAAGAVHLSFNGEILNYRQLRSRFPGPYATAGDTETILAAYLARGASAVRELEGQFAFALFDERTGELLLARDRLGILPLYYYSDERVFAFASEVKALIPAMTRSLEVDTDSLDQYLTRRSVPAPHTLFKHVRKLPPGHTMVVDHDRVREPRRYWGIPSAQAQRTISDADAVEQVHAALEGSVRASLIADVPVGAYLSGGVDSSLIVALMSRLREGEGVETFAAGFAESAEDELPIAREVSALFGTTHHEVVVTAEDFLQLWPRLTWHRDAPLSEPADVAVFQLATLARRSVRVVLSGEGSDEIFGGYPKYRYAGLTRWAGVVPAAVRTPALLRLAEALPASRSKLAIAVRALSSSSEADRRESWFAPFVGTERTALLRTSATLYRRPAQPTGRALRRMLQHDTEYWLPDNLLERGDRMSMAASLELRPPFLDRKVVEMAFGLPDGVKVRGSVGKWVVKEVARKYLPPHIVDRRKVGFRVPLDRWLRGDLETFAYDLLLDPGSFASAFADTTVIRRLLDRHRSGEANDEMRIWTLLSLEVWHQASFRANQAASSCAPPTPANRTP